MIVFVQVTVSDDEGNQIAESGRREMVVQVGDFEQNMLRTVAAITTFSDETREAVKEQLGVHQRVWDEAQGSPPGRHSSTRRR